MTPCKLELLAMHPTKSSFHTARPWLLAALAGLSCALASSSSFAEDAKSPGTDKKSDGDVSVGLDPALSLDPSTPQAGAIAGGMAPAYGRQAAGANDWRFDFHGLLIAPLNAGINTRENPLAGQSKTVLHAPPV